MNVSIQKLHPDAILPQYSSADAAGADLCSVEEITIAPGETKLAHTGLAIFGQNHLISVGGKNGFNEALNILFVFNQKDFIFVIAHFQNPPQLE